MNVWRLCFVMIFLNATISLHGMEIDYKTEHEKTLSPDAIKIRRYLFSKKQLIRHRYVDSTTIFLNNLDDFLDSFSRVVRTSPNIANSYDRFYGISCVIRPGKDLITADIKTRDVTMGQHSYKIRRKDTSSICSLAYTPKCIAAGFLDGSFAAIHLDKDRSHVASPCHKGPVTSICIPSPHTYVLGGGKTVGIHTLRGATGSFEDGDAIVFDGTIMSLGIDKKGNWYCGDIVAVAGPFIVMQTKENQSLIKSIYSPDAFNAIQYGIFTESQKSVLKRMIDAQDNKLPLVLSDEDHDIFGSLCPTIRHVLQH
jgi:hypothetical protein